MSDIIYGINPVTESLKTRETRIKKILLAKEKEAKGLKELLNLARKGKVVVEYKERRLLDQISGIKHPQGVLAIVSAYRETDLDEIIESWQNSGEKLLALDSICSSTKRNQTDCRASRKQRGGCSEIH